VGQRRVLDGLAAGDDVRLLDRVSDGYGDPQKNIGDRARTEEKRGDHENETDEMNGHAQMHADGLGHASDLAAVRRAQQRQSRRLGRHGTAFAQGLHVAPAHVDRAGLVVLFLRVSRFG
jgi:hypothetical protein